MKPTLKDVMEKIDRLRKYKREPVSSKLHQRIYEAVHEIPHIERAAEVRRMTSKEVDLIP